MVKTKRRAGPGSVAIYPGSFDPLTHGHLDVIERGARIFPRFIVAILKNPEKKALFSLAERMRLLRDVVEDLPGIEVDSFSGLLVDYARARDATVLVRGLRAVSDFEYEFQMALMNRRLNPRVETVFMAPCEEYSYLSSRLARQVFFLGGDLRGLVPALVLESMGAKRADRE